MILQLTIGSFAVPADLAEADVGALAVLGQFFVACVAVCKVKLDNHCLSFYYKISLGNTRNERSRRPELGYDEPTNRSVSVETPIGISAPDKNIRGNELALWKTKFNKHELRNRSRKLRGARDE